MGEEKIITDDHIEVDLELMEDIADLLHSKSDLLLKNILNDLYPADIAHIVNRLEFEDAEYLFSLLSTEDASKVIVELDDNHREHFLLTLKSEELTEIVEELPTDEATDIVSELSKEKAEEVLDELSAKDSTDLQELLKYDENTAGGIMQKEVITVRKTDTVKKAIQAVRKKAKEEGNIHQQYVIYVTDEEGVLVGVVPISNLILLSPNRRIYKVMDADIISVNTSVDQEEVAHIFKKYNLVSIPVVDFRNRLVGKIMVDDVVDVIEEEASEDILRMGGVSEDEHISTSPIVALRRRLPWLYVNLLTAFLAASVVGLFQHTIEKVVILAALMPIVAGMGGNAATQTITVMVRGLALGEVTNSNRKKVLWKELQIGLMNGFANGILTGSVIAIFSGIPMLGIVICLAMITNMFVAGFAGTVVPLTLQWLKIDPALASAVVVTTFTDVFGFASFLGLATLFITLLL
jgi:magnesium transporter